MGRVDHQVKLRGFRIELGEIEVMLNQLPEVEEVVVLVREDTPGQQRLVAYVVTSEDIAVNSLRNTLKADCPDYMVPGAFVVLDALPLTANGKVDRRALPLPGQEAVGSDYVAPRDDRERTLVDLWCRLLAVEKIGIRDNFFDLGGHSLLATQVIAHVREQFQVEISLRRLFEEPTIEVLATLIGVAEPVAEGAGQISRVAREEEEETLDLAEELDLDNLSEEDMDAMLGELMDDDEEQF